VLSGDARKEFVELARDGRLRDYRTRPAGACELPRLAAAQRAMSGRAKATVTEARGSHAIFVSQPGPCLPRAGRPRGTAVRN
jgi:hypothetical protein